jgi:hypothetical protein
MALSLELKIKGIYLNRLLLRSRTYNMGKSILGILINEFDDKSSSIR